MLEKNILTWIYSCSLDTVPKPGMPLPPHVMAHPRMPTDNLSVVPRGSPVYPQPQLPEMCYDSRPPPSASQYDPQPYSTGRHDVNNIMYNSTSVSEDLQCSLIIFFYLKVD